MRWIAACGFLAVLLLGGLSSELIRNEGLRARLAEEVLVSGNWLVPHLDGQPHLTKPPGMSVLIALCSLPAGQVTEWTARLPSVLAAALVIGLFAWTFQRCAGAGWLAAVVLPACPLWLDRLPSAEIDLVQLAWVAAAMLCFLRAVEAAEACSTGSRSTHTESLWWLAALLCVAGGFFTKWTAPAFFYLTVLPFLAWRGQLRLLGRAGHLGAACLFVALTVGWLGSVALSVGWTEVRDALSREALLRLSPSHHPRPYPWDELLTFPLAFLAGCLPWAILAAVALVLRPREESAYRLWQLCLVWLVTSLVFWTVVPGHRPRHILPAQPAVAGLAVLGCLTWRRWTLLPTWIGNEKCLKNALAGLLLLWLGVKLVHVAWVLPARVEARQPRRAAERLAALVPTDAVLHVRGLKDDGLLFYYARPVCRLQGMPPAGAWCLLSEKEFSSSELCLLARELSLPGWGRLIPQAWLRDGQGESLLLAVALSAIDLDSDNAR